MLIAWYIFPSMAGDTVAMDNSHLQLELTSLKEELSVAQGDIRRYSEDATQTQELYQHELMQHSKSVQSLVEIKEKVCVTILAILVLVM